MLPIRDVFMLTVGLYYRYHIIRITEQQYHCVNVDIASTVQKVKGHKMGVALQTALQKACQWQTPVALSRKLVTPSLKIKP